MKLKTLILCSALFLTLPVGSTLAQSIVEVRTEHVVIAKRATLAIKYPERDGTSVDMIGTAVQPRARGKAEVKRENGRTRIRLELENLDNPQNLGAYYTTYVLWAVAPEGQADNIGELSLADNKSKIEVTTPNQTFGIIVTAEPHGLVKLPSPAIVAENVLRENTKGGITTSQIDYRGDSGVYYVVRDSSLAPDYATPLVVLGARRAVEIARRAGAGEYAVEELRQAENKLHTLESMWVRQRSKEKVYSGEARDVMRLGELARSLSVERAEQARLDAERRAADRAIARSQNDADSARTEADRSRIEAERARMETENYRAALRRAEDEVIAARKRAENAQTEAERAKANEEVARLEAERARLEKNEAKQETQQAQLTAEQAQRTAEQAQRDAQAAKRERDALQQRLYVSIAAILDTRREARGLIVNLSDVLFDFNKATLKPGAREKLSKLAGILLAYPGQYHLEIEGHTDSIGSDDYNQKLSEGRAGAVRDYLAQEGIKSEKITAVRGLGKSKPVTTNDTAEGRQMNRRVEIVIADSETPIPASINSNNKQ
jgi:outer membrane protein OmpA-like peptidoglycan-associated protein